MTFKKGHIPWNKDKKTGIGYWKGKKRPNLKLRHFYKKGVTGKKHNRWRGGRQKTGKGYVHILKHNHPCADKRGRIYEHRYVMEQHLKRYLHPKEVVHHINGKRDDNRLENLELFKSSGDHTRIEYKINPWNEKRK